MRSNQREIKRGGGRAAGTGREPAAPKPPRTDAGAARQAGRRGAGAGITVETLRGPEATQTEGRAEQQMGGAEAGRGERNERPGEGAGAGAERGGREAKTELTENTDPFVSRVCHRGHFIRRPLQRLQPSARGQQWSGNIDITCSSAPLGKEMN